MTENISPTQLVQNHIYILQCGSCGSGGIATNQLVGGSIPDSSSLHLKVSLGRILNPKLGRILNPKHYSLYIDIWKTAQWNPGCSMYIICIKLCPHQHHFPFWVDLVSSPLHVSLGPPQLTWRSALHSIHGWSGFSQWPKIKLSTLQAPSQHSVKSLIRDNKQTHNKDKLSWLLCPLKTTKLDFWIPWNITVWVCFMMTFYVLTAIDR